MGNPKKAGISAGIAVGVAIAAFVVVGMVVGNPLFKISKQQTISIVNETISVAAGGYNYYTFSVPDRVSNPMLSGSFIASGGNENTINVKLLDLQNFFKFKNGQKADAIYATGPENAGTINANLPTNQTFFLVYDNTFSVNSTKQVATDVSLKYNSR